MSDFLDDLEPVQILMAKKLSGTNNFTRKRDSVWLAQKKSSTWLVLNYTLIIAKYHIFAKSVGNGSLDFEGFLSRLKSKLTVLRTIASINHNHNLQKLGPLCYKARCIVCVLLSACVCLAVSAALHS